ncbi:hypothetical protein [uncultured Desulfuromusa sp.]|uniref:hypothetical protein n=1 Tax=uncultured Desulfuromusa sp. TaxID=219183 RepID=UPI002AA7FE5C|nr:hypothetical protein [uncultured Desulfuromusa sp.]
MKILITGGAGFIGSAVIHYNINIDESQVLELVIEEKYQFINDFLLEPIEFDNF